MGIDWFWMTCRYAVQPCCQTPSAPVPSSSPARPTAIITPVSRVLSAHPAQIGTPIRAHFISDLSAPLASLEPSPPAHRQVTNTTRVDASESEIDNSNACAWQPCLGQLEGARGMCPRPRTRIPRLGGQTRTRARMTPSPTSSSRPLPTPAAARSTTSRQALLSALCEAYSAVDGLRGWEPRQSMRHAYLSALQFLARSDYPSADPHFGRVEGVHHAVMRH